MNKDEDEEVRKEIEIAYLKNSIRPCFVFISQTAFAPPTSEHPWIINTMMPAKSMNACTVSVYTTAFAPPCIYIFILLDRFRVDFLIVCFRHRGCVQHGTLPLVDSITIFNDQILV